MNFNNVTRTYTLKSTIKTYGGNQFGCLKAFTFMSDNSTTYYVNDYCNGNVLIFNQNWNYLTFKFISYYLEYSMVINNYLYLTAYSFGIFKTDKYLNIIGNYVSDYFEGMYYNSSSNSIFVASYYDNRIVELTLDLSFISSIDTNYYMPFSINGANNKLYVGTFEGDILVLINRKISQVYLGCKSIGSYFTASSILFDNYGNVGVNCYSSYDNYFAVFFINGTFTGNKLLTPVTNSESPDVKFDSLNRLIAISSKQISIFY